VTYKDFKIPDDCPDEYKDKISYIETKGNDILITLKNGYSTKDVWPIVEYFHKDNIDYVFCGVEGSIIRCMQGFKDLDCGLVKL